MLTDAEMEAMRDAMMTPEAVAAERAEIDPAFAEIKPWMTGWDVAAIERRNRKMFAHVDCDPMWCPIVAAEYKAATPVDRFDPV